MAKGFDIRKPSRKDYIRFLEKVLQVTTDAIIDSDADLQVVQRVVDRLLKANIDLLNERLDQVLREWARAKLSQVSSTQALLIASAIRVFSRRIEDFPQGEWASKLEVAIAGYESTATVRIRSVLTDKEWAITECYLGSLYCKRIGGEKAENIESAIRCFEAALEVDTRQAYPQEWAETQNNLGSLYCDRVRGDKAENVEKAICCFEVALKVNTCQTFPEIWATTQYNLGHAYSQRILGKWTENLEMAIEHFLAALQVFTHKYFPQEWAKIQNNLGGVYSKRIQGKKTENLESAIRCFSTALEVRTRQALPFDWAMIQNNLGCVYIKRIQGEKKENLETAIQYLSNALQVRIRQAFPQEWAETQYNLGLAYSNRIQGNKAENLEAAIRYYLSALEVYTRQSFPEKWADTQYNLGGVYFKRIQGDKAENLEAAIRCYLDSLDLYTCQNLPEKSATIQYYLGIVFNERIRGERAENLEMSIKYYLKALEVLTYEAFPEKWANTQYNLGAVHPKRIQEGRAENFEEAIRCYLNALKVFTREGFPEEWATVQLSLGAAYDNRIRGKRAENLEMAIGCYLDALKVNTREAFPEEWAMIQHNLGNTYGDRIRGERAENLEMAILCHLNALEVRTREAFPEQWANTQRCLGVTYRDRIRGEKSDNLEEAIRCYSNASEIHTREAFPDKWANIQLCLGNAYHSLGRGESAENLELAIRYYLNALEVHTREAFPDQWANIQTCLGGVYLNRIWGEKVENWEVAIRCHLDALEVHTREAFPEKWANIQYNLGSAYLYRRPEKTVENLAMAIHYYLNALNIHTREAFPQYYAETQKNLGFAYQASLQFQDAYSAFAAAIDTVESLRGEIVKGSGREDDKQKLAEEWNDLYQSTVQVCIVLDYLDQAVEYAERSKARNLVELLANRDVYPKGNVPPEIITQLDRLRREIPAVQRQLEDSERNRNIASLRSSNGETLSRNQFPIGEQTRSDSIRNELNTSQQQLTEVLEQIKDYDREFKLTQEVQPIQFSDIQALLDDRTTILEWYITDLFFYTFIITRHNPKPLFWYSFTTTDREELEKWAENYRNSYTKQKDKWRNELSEQLAELSRILHIDEIIELIPPHITQLILIPHRWLHLFPLHALPVGDAVVRSRRLLPENSELEDRLPDGYRLLDCFPDGVRYAPSCQLLQLAQKRQLPHSQQNLFAIQDPTEDLPYTNLEVEVIQSKFKPAHVLPKAAATKAALTQGEALKTAHYAHFSCHGSFNFAQPLKSALILANAVETILQESTVEATNELSQKQRDRSLPWREGKTVDGDKCLTLIDIFEKLNLPQCRLVTLSACETGLTTFDSRSDEYIGLPSGFLFAGSPSVVSSLWSVSDLSTAFLIIKFYDNLQTMPSVAIALNQAQKWLRNLTTEEFKRLLKEFEPQINAIFAQLSKIERLKADKYLEKACERQPHPFANPFYWAAFSATGV
ncbi:tetratricopeptide repeat protein [Microcoleus sp. FACHB-831]|uniref:CHAT domain-containing protein n=1 Tax=Microcoleus sp. FACHB-831 TaxID=2692827 RepID=UPI0016864296|nr:CHAT domain-containing protein [Microcoleus sp. FACHB-831]MBD1922683.1 tetratricopeptide repeat protein [Microcoleus sp. FACHB-831]